MGEIIFLLLLAAGAVSYLIEASGYPMPRFEVSGGPAIYPKMILTVFLILAAVRIIQIISSREKEKFVFSELFVGTRGVFWFAFILYVLVVKTIGYHITTSLFLIGMTEFFYYKKAKFLGTPKQILLRSTGLILFVAGMYWFFAATMNVLLPKGLLAGIL